MDREHVGGRSKAFIDFSMCYCGPTPDPSDVETAWQQEIQKRIASAESGEASFMSWEEVKKRLRGE